MDRFFTTQRSRIWKNPSTCSSWNIWELLKSLRGVSPITYQIMKIWYRMYAYEYSQELPSSNLAPHLKVGRPELPRPSGSILFVRGSSGVEPRVSKPCQSSGSRPASHSDTPRRALP